MAFLHSFAIIGVIVGYISGAVIVTYLKEFVQWQFAFQIQSYFMIGVGLGFLFSDNSAVDIFQLIKSREEEKKSDNQVFAAASVVRDME